MRVQSSDVSLPDSSNHSLCLIKLRNSSYPEGNFGGNQLLDGSISLSPLYAVLTNDLPLVLLPVVVLPVVVLPVVVLPVVVLPVVVLPVVVLPLVVVPVGSTSGSITTGSIATTYNSTQTNQ